MAFFNKSINDWLGKKMAVAPIVTTEEETQARQKAVKEIAMYTAVGLIADIACGCERQVYRNGELTRDGTWYVWNLSPNQNQSASELLTRWIFDIYYRPEGGLLVPVRGRLYAADGFRVDEYSLKEDTYSSISIGQVTLNKTYKAGGVYHVRLLDRKGRCIAQLVNDAFRGYAELLNSAADGYKKSSGEKYEIALDHLPGGTETEKQKYLELVKKNMAVFVSGKDGAYPHTKEQTITRYQAAASGSASGYTDLRKDVYSVVAEALHLPASLMDGNMNNTSEVLNQALTFAIGPLCHRLSEEITRKTYSQEEIAAGCRVSMDTTRIRIRDAVDAADKLDKLISSGIMCIDEAREQCALPPLNEDWSEAHYLTKNYDSIDNPHEGGEENAENYKILQPGES